jgi:hypothetical protein
MSDQSISLEELQNALADLPADPAPAPRSNPLDLKAFVDPAQLRKDVDVDMTDLDNEVRRQSATYLFYAQRASMAKAQAARTKASAEIIESKLYALHRQRLIDEGGKVTEAVVDAAVKNDRRYYEMKQKLVDANLHADLARDAAVSMEQRKDMLVQLTADRRKEREGELRMGVAKDVVESTRKDVLQHLAAQAVAA